MVPLTANNEVYDSKPAANENLKSEPQIGMTSDEVKASNWGEPIKINKTTTANNVSEQWVYTDSFGNTKYIYLDNGIVTSIQD